MKDNQAGPGAGKRAGSSPVGRWHGRPARLWSVGWLCALLGCALSARAQWTTQSLELKAGWNGVYLHVDASHDTLANLVGADLNNPILEVWLWAPPVSTVQFVKSPQEPVDGTSQWRSWNRNTGEGGLQRLIGNAAYLVRVAGNVPAYTWQVHGKPVVPAYEWTTTGLNFLGFPSHPGQPPTWQDFLQQAPELQLNAEVYHYPGGELGPSNPARLFAFRTARIPRGQAFWIRSGTYFNRYFAPFELALSGSSGLHFGDALNGSNFRLRNLTTNVLTVTLDLVPSETPPAGQPAIAGVPSLMLRGSLNTATLTYSYTNLAVGTPRAITLTPQGQPGSDLEVVLGLDRASLAGTEGALSAAVLRLTDSLGFSRVELPVSATVASTAGLWVGEAVVNVVQPYLAALQRAVTNAVPAESAPPGGADEDPEPEDPTNVPRHFPLRLIVHNPVRGQDAVLLQQVFFGLDGDTNPVVATAESALNPAYLGEARRLSSSHLPWSATNRCWTFSGRLGDSTNLTVNVDLDYADHASNPFLHTYHPDHDNLDPTFKTRLPQGMESYAVTRTISLAVQVPAGDAFTLAGNGQSVSGVYRETLRLTGLARAGGTHDTREFQVEGAFRLNRVAEVPVLTRATAP